MNKYFRHYFGGPRGNDRGCCCCWISKQIVKLDISPLVSQLWGSSVLSKEAKFFKKFEFIGFIRCFSVRIEYISKNHPKITQFGWILDVFENCSILAEKQRLKLKKLNSLMNFASLGAQLDPQLARLVEWNESGVQKPCVQNMQVTLQSSTF